MRGNARTSGEERRKEAGNVFGSGSRAPIAITILVKNGNQKSNAAKIHYTEVDDYLSRDEKLSTLVNLKSILSEKNKHTLIKPNAKHDWINKREENFDKMIIIADKKDKHLAEKAFCDYYSNGLKTNRDTWCYNFSKDSLVKNIKTTISSYNYYLSANFTKINPDSTKISLSRELEKYYNRKIKINFDETKVIESYYRPFIKSNLYYSKYLNEMIYQMPKLFPTGNEENLLICIAGIGVSKDFSALITNKVTDVQFQQNGQCFPLYYYEQPTEGDLFAQDKMIRHDGITDYILQRAHHLYNDLKITKEDIFYYIYGFLHLPTYREKFANELKKSLPRIILVPETEKFWQLSRAGRALAEIHLNYENQEPPHEIIVEGIEHNNFKVQKMKLSADKTTLIYNSFIKIKNLPPRSFEYIVNGRSPLEWIIDRYQVKIDKASGIENNPNLWCSEHNDEKYILNLILSTLTVSLKTLDIVDSLPEVNFD